MSRIQSVSVVVIGLALLGYGLMGEMGSKSLSPDGPVGDLVADLPEGELCTVKPGSVYDGDTLRVLCSGAELKIRMCGIDAPEVKPQQPLGIESRDYLRELLPDGAQVVVVQVEEDRYGRTVAEIWNDAAPEPFVNGAMVLKGLAWHYTRYSGNCPGRAAIARAEEIAKAESLGIFAPGNIPPWEWRKQK